MYDSSQYYGSRDFDGALEFSGDIVVFAVMNDAVGMKYLSKPSLEYFDKIGSTEYQKLEHQDSWVFIGNNSPGGMIVEQRKDQLSHKVATLEHRIKLKRETGVISYSICDFGHKLRYLFEIVHGSPRTCSSCSNEIIQ